MPIKQLLFNNDDEVDDERVGDGDGDNDCVRLFVTKVGNFNA